MLNLETGEEKALLEFDQCLVLVKPNLNLICGVKDRGKAPAACIGVVVE